MSNVALQNGNSYAGDGGAMAVVGTATLTACTFSGNTALLGGYAGGAIAIYGTAILTDCIFFWEHRGLWRRFVPPRRYGAQELLPPWHRISKEQ
jgi:hypothetical protein